VKILLTMLVTLLGLTACVVYMDGTLKSVFQWVLAVANCRSSAVFRSRRLTLLPLIEIAPIAGTNSAICAGLGRLTIVSHSGPVISRISGIAARN